MKYTLNMPNDLEDLVRNGDFGINFIHYDRNYKLVVIEFYATDKFIELAEEYGRTDENKVIDFVITIVNGHILMDYCTILQNKGYNDEKIEEMKDEEFNDMRQSEYDVKRISYFDKFHKDYQKHLIEKNIEFFSPIPDEEFPYITMISDVYNYHMRKFYNEFDVILDRLVSFMEYTSICVTNIVKEGDTTVFYIDLPKPTEDSNRYMLLQYSLDIKPWFEETFLRFKREMFAAKYGYRLLDKTNFKVKAIVTSFSEEDEEKRKELNKAYTTYLFTLANNTIGYKYYKGEEE